MRCYLFLVLILFSNLNFALTFSLPKKTSNIIGCLQTIIVKKNQTITDIVKKYDVGYKELEAANPGINLNGLISGTMLVLPTRYILPETPRVGIVINLSEMRLYYYPADRSVVMTFPVGVGKIGSPTPLLITKITKKYEHPIWIPSRNTREKELVRGVLLPRVIRAGKHNPLGDYAMRLGVPIYLIHGTNNIYGVGRRSSGGCIRMLPQDIKILYNLVKIGTKVEIVQQPLKMSWLNRQLYLEVHNEFASKSKNGTTKTQLQREFIPIFKLLLNKLSQQANINWDAVITEFNKCFGIPRVVGKMYFNSGIS